MALTKTEIPQLLKWVGNKHRFAKEIVSYMPEQINTYYEPFLGSGAVLGTLCYENSTLIPRFQNAVGSDVLPFLIEIFNYVKDNPEVLKNHYRNCIENYNENREANYLEIRDRFNSDFNALDFAVLSRTCYSGIIRFRKRDGFMSTPIGPHNPISPDSFSERVEIWHDIFKNNNVNFYNQDFKASMDMAQNGDLVYCDPPYTHSQSILYGAQSFDIEDLWIKIKECKERGVKVMLSINANKKSGKEDISVKPPEGLFERVAYVNCGVSMINRLQRAGSNMQEEIVNDALFLTW